MGAPVLAPPAGFWESARSRLTAVVSVVRPAWSGAAAVRAVRAAIVVPGLFALSTRVIGNGQVATFAAFGGFATLVLAAFGGGRRDKLVAHCGLAVAGSVLVVLGTAVNSITVLAALVTLVVAFCVLFAGVTSANAASGATAALLAYILPAASPGTIAMIPDRLAGWWMASVAGTIAVLVFFVPPPTDRLRQAAAGCAEALADHIGAALAGADGLECSDAVMKAKHELLSAYTAVPYRPTGLTATDQAIANLVEDLQWCCSAVLQAFGDRSRCSQATGEDRARLAESGHVLRLTADLASGGSAPGLEQGLARLEGDLPAGDVTYEIVPADGDPLEETLHRRFHSRMVAAATYAVARDALIAARRIKPDGAVPPDGRLGVAGRIESGVASGHAAARAAGRLLGGHTNLRSIWFLNSARGAVALATAVAVADLTNVQHGFWVVLGALSVLRTNAASTGATALRALAGTALGFFFGAALILAIGSHDVALWVVLPIAVLFAAYTPGTAPFAVGQAAFTVTISILYNIIAPVGWKVGELRVEDVALGAAVSAIAGFLFWPRGAASVVAEDLADAFHTGGLYLVQATSWALGIRTRAPDGAAPVAAAGARLDEATRALITEQGAKRVPKETVWRLAGGALRLRLVARAVAATETVPARPPPEDSRVVLGEAVRVAGLYDGLAAQLGHTPATVAQELAGLNLDDSGVEELSDPRVIWVHEHLDHLKQNLGELSEPAAVVGQRMTTPWWR